MLKFTRRTLALLSIICITLLFVDFTGTARYYFGWLTSIQLIPAIMSASVISLLILLAITLIFGRVYCSVICPLGILQDVFSRLGRLTGPRSFTYAPSRNKIRITVLWLFATLFILGLTSLASATIAGLIEPYSAYGRICSALFAPVYDAANNAMLSWGDRDGYSMFYEVHRISSVLTVTVALITLAIVGTSAWFTGRGYCNTVCPVGTILGYLSRYSILRPMIDNSKCTGCGKCAKRCKSSCIDPVNRTIDYTKCVVCMDCVSDCRYKAISYTNYYRSKPAPVTQDAGTESAPKKATDPSRRLFIATGALLGASLASKAGGTLGDFIATPSKKPLREWPVSPPGAMSTANQTSRCIGCQLCVSSCPSSVLKPSTELGSMMVSFLDFSEGFCRPECNVCGQVCPTGAINLLDLPTKASTRIGYAVVDYEACISSNIGRRCKACERNCPTGAIIRVENGKKKIPVVNTAICIGCGSCEYHCPTGRDNRSVKAIHVEGSETHQTI